MRRLADCRYAGQGYEVRFDVPAGDGRRRLGRGAEGRASTARTSPSTATASTREIEIINIRAVGIGRVDELQPDRARRAATATRRARGRSSARSSSTSRASRRRGRTPFYERERLRAGDRIEGPAIIEQYDSTTVIPPGLAAEIDRHGNIVVDCIARARATEASAAPGSRRRS